LVVIEKKAECSTGAGYCAPKKRFAIEGTVIEKRQLNYQGQK